MTAKVPGNSVRTDRTVPDVFLPHKYVDIHCHCLAGLDDGPATTAEAIALCRAIVNDGIKTVIATPHQLGRFEQTTDAKVIRQAVLAINQQLSENNIGLTIVPGADVRVDERILELLDADKILTLADGGKYLLLELPYEVFIDIEPLLAQLAERGIQTIISHPERYYFLPAHYQKLLKWLDYPVHLQITAASLIGKFGPSPQRIAWDLISDRLANLVATDSHDTNQRSPCMTAAYEIIAARLGQARAQLLCVENPSRVLKGLELLTSQKK